MEASSGVTREPCSSESRLRSLTSDTSLSLDFQNGSPGPVTIHWLDFNGRRVHYADLEVGQSYRQQTYVTHPWIALDADGGCRGVFLPRAAGEHAVVIRAR